jgi:WD40 repeat protein
VSAFLASGHSDAVHARPGTQGGDAGGSVAIECVAFSPEGRRVVTATADDAQVWDVASGRPLRTLRHNNGVFCASFSPDAKWVVAGEDRITRVWDAESGRSVSRLRGDLGGFSPYGNQIVTAVTLPSDFANREIQDPLWDKAVIWDVKTGRRLHVLDSNEGVSSANFSPDGKLVVTARYAEQQASWDAGQGTAAVVFDAATGRRLRTLSDPRPNLSVDDAAFSPDGRRVLTYGGHDGRAASWDTAGGRILRLFQGGNDHVYDAFFSPDGKRVVTIAETVRVWDSASGRMLYVLPDHSVSDGSFSSDGRWLLTLGNTARVWDAGNGRALYGLKLKGVDGTYGADFSPNGRQVAAVSNDGTAKIWDVTTGRLLRALRHT